MDLTWLDPQHLDQRDVAGGVAVLEAARLVDSPHWLPHTTSSLTTLAVHGWDGDPPQVALLRNGDRRVLGVLQVHLPTWDNRHLGWLDIAVDPRVRRRGYGRALFEAGAARTREAGRTMLVAESFDHEWCVSFAKAMGLDRASDEVQRQQDLASLDWTRLAREEQQVLERAADYDLVRLAGATPPDLRATVVDVNKAINDAPTDDLDVEDEVFTVERLLAFEKTQDLFGRRVYRIVARHRETGAPAGQTMMAIDREFPWEGKQYDTSVVRGHRGHRLGLRLKIAMLRWLQEAEPQLVVVSTWNAASNDHMIEVNEILGYHVVAGAIAWQQHL